MPSKPYPSSPENIDTWCDKYHFPRQEGQKRFVSFLILQSFDASPILSKSLVFKGGNALRFVYQNSRSTIDLDFTVVNNCLKRSVEELRKSIDNSLLLANRRYNVRARTQKIEARPKSANATHPTYLVKVGYQFFNEKYFNQILQGKDVSSIIPLDISFADLICESQILDLQDNGKGHLRVGTLEDILAEKLRSLLQQPIRNRNRKQDVFDLARLFQVARDQIDLLKVSDFLMRKCNERDIDARKQKFDQTVREMASIDYERLKESVPENEFIPFDQAWKTVRKMVELLTIPD